eukprot:TRINITY_DN12003_c0_g1_i1.p1 TRINITY_DN12003_c0_g1~~TRINITY_DN12003_c0_g1_i1.p1  ORF type:complete len:1256 (-),score=257.41 TRINITY_DN12003_c0_g1_i1:102-3869(-)
MDIIARKNLDSRLRHVENLVDPQSKRFRADAEYDIKEQIGRGAYSVVKRARHRRSAEEVAIKIIDKKENADVLDLIRREIEVLRLLSHPNVVRLRETYEDSYVIEIVMDIISGGELFEVIVEKGFFSEDDSAFIIRQILLGVLHCHQRKVVHRDLKPENLLCVNTDDGSLSRIVICDFGVSMQLPPDGSLLTGRFGSADYISPEMHLDKEYSLSTDMWSLGVISYIILAGYPPFIPANEDDDMSIASAVINEEVQFPEEEWSIISPMAKDFIQRLLQKEPSQRMTAAQALMHPFMSSRFGDVVDNLVSAAEKDASSAATTAIKTPRSVEDVTTPEIVIETTTPAVVVAAEPIEGGPSIPSSPRAPEDASDTMSGTESTAQGISSAEPSPRPPTVEPDQPATTTATATPAAAAAAAQKRVIVTAIEVGGLAPQSPPQVLTARSKAAQDAAAAKRAQNLKQFNAKRRFAGAKNLFKFFSNKIFGESSGSSSSSGSTSKSSGSKSGSSSSTKVSNATPAPAPAPAGDASPKSKSSSSKRGSQQRSAPVSASASSPQLFKSKVNTPNAPTTAPTTTSSSTTPPQSHSPTGGSPKGSPRNSSPRTGGNSPRGAGMVSSSSNPNLASSSSAPVDTPAHTSNTSSTKDSISSSPANQSQSLSGFALLKKRFESLVSSPPTPQQPVATTKTSSSKQLKKDSSTGATATQPDNRATVAETRSRSATTVDFGPVAFETRSPKRRSRHGAVDPRASLTAEDADLVTPSADLLTPSNSDSPHKPSLIRVHSAGKEERRRSHKKVSRQGSTKSDASGTSSQSHALSSLEELTEPLSPKAFGVQETSSTASSSPEVERHQQPPSNQTPAPPPAAAKSRPPSTYDSFFGNLGSLSMSDLPSFSLETRSSSTSTPPEKSANVTSTAPSPAKASAPGTRGRTRSGTISVIGPGVISSSDPVPTIDELRNGSPERPRSPSKRAIKVKDIVGNFESLKAQQEQAAAAVKPKKAAEKQQQPAAPAGDQKTSSDTQNAAASEKPRKSAGSGLLRIMSVGIFNRKKVTSGPASSGESSGSSSPLSDSSTGSPVSTPKSGGNGASALSRSKSTISMPKEIQRASEPQSSSVSSDPSVSDKKSKRNSIKVSKRRSERPQKDTPGSDSSSEQATLPQDAGAISNTTPTEKQSPAEPVEIPPRRSDSPTRGRSNSVVGTLLAKFSGQSSPSKAKVPAVSAVAAAETVGDEKAEKRKSSKRASEKPSKRHSSQRPPVDVSST